MTSSGKSSQSFTSPLEVQSPALPAVVEAQDGGHQVEGDVQRHYLQYQARRYSPAGAGGGHLVGHGVWPAVYQCTVGVFTGGGKPTN